ncbi:MAG TPA: hypothetical protein PLI09_25485, partial [Candidatus Hydrogenedentes bacterium]|nr:hypothetical protein [Candidatus Hydrogenedentota bacterium]
MNYVKTIVCFANSRKWSGRCIAGKEWHKGVPGEWVRPISVRTTHELSEEERRYDNGHDPRLLDILHMPCTAPQPSSHQKENHLIDPDCCWSKQGNLIWDNIYDWLDNPKSLWMTGQSSYSGLN